MPIKTKKVPEVQLREWADARGIKYRTAQRWAKDGVIAARKQTVRTKAVVTRVQTVYLVPKTTKIPA